MFPGHGSHSYLPTVGWIDEGTVFMKPDSFENTHPYICVTQEGLFGSVLFSLNLSFYSIYFRQKYYEKWDLISFPLTFFPFKK